MLVVRGRAMKLKPTIFPLIFPFAFLSASAQATDFFCNNYVAGAPLPHFQCVQTTVGPGAPMVLSPEQAGGAPLFASSVSAGSGSFASASVASASAAPGLLRGFASAQMLGGSIEGAQAVARSDAWFSDGERWWESPASRWGHPSNFASRSMSPGGSRGAVFSQP
jgi:hypothetical protein